MSGNTSTEGRLAIAEQEAPYDPIVILQDGVPVLELDLDDAPVREYNERQWKLSRLIVAAVNAYQQPAEPGEDAIQLIRDAHDGIHAWNWRAREDWRDRANDYLITRPIPLTKDTQHG
jgi:hypothetical protein